MSCIVYSLDMQKGEVEVIFYEGLTDRLRFSTEVSLVVPCIQARPDSAECKPAIDYQMGQMLCSTKGTSRSCREHLFGEGFRLLLLEHAAPGFQGNYPGLQ